MKLDSYFNYMDKSIRNINLNHTYNLNGIDADEHSYITKYY